MVLVHRLYFCFAFVIMYRPPTIPNMLQSLRSANRRSMSKTKIVPEQFEETVYGRKLNLTNMQMLQLQEVMVKF